MKIVMRASVCLAVLGLTLCLGCVLTGGRCTMTVGNESESLVKSVTVDVDGIVRYAVSSIAVEEEGEYRRWDGPLPKAVTVAWQDETGKSFSVPVRSDQTVPNDFTGRLFFQIEKNGDVKAFLIQDTAEGTVLPWSKRETWEGSVSIPGLSDE